MRKTVRILAAAALVLSLSAVADASVCAIVTVGGGDVDAGQGGPPNNDANLSLIAILNCDGGVRGQWQDTFAGGVGIHVNVNCVEVDGNDAWISGPIKKVTPTGTCDECVGLEVRTRLRDNGTSSQDPPDQAGFFFFSEGPNECLLRLDEELFDLVNGQVQIKEF